MRKPAHVPTSPKDAAVAAARPEWEAWITPEARAAFAREIESVGGAEVFAVATLDAAGVIVAIEPFAFGNRRAVPALLQIARPGEIAVHNHPSGNLEPSDADIDFSSELAQRGVGSWIVDNTVSRRRVIVKALPPPSVNRLDVAELEAMLQPGGRIASRMAGYEVRAPQLAMLRAVAEAFNRDGIAVIEAATGTGKSLAYLLPAIRWARANGEPVAVSTGTINLQEQLVHKDLPLIAEALGEPVEIALLKGRGNYLCRRKADYAARHPNLLGDPAKRGQLAQIQAWVATTTDGSRETLPFTPDEDVWELVMSETDNCLRAQCPFYENCFYYNARRRAARAHVLVVNHHLLMTDLAVRAQTDNYTAAAVLPPVRRLVLDEAHHLEEVATEYLGSRVGRATLRFALRRLKHPRTGAGALQQVAQALLAGHYPLDPTRRDELVLALVRDLPAQHDELLAAIDEAVELVGSAMEQAADRRAPEADPTAILKRRIGDDELTQEPWCNALVEPLQRIVTTARPYLEGITSIGRELRRFLENATTEAATPLLELQAALHRVEDGIRALMRFLADGEGQCRWIEYRRGQERRPADAMFCLAPLEVGDTLRERLLRRMHTVVLTSATLAVERNLDFFMGRVGATDPSRLGTAGGHAPPPDADAVATTDGTPDAPRAHPSLTVMDAARAARPRPLTTLVLDTPFDYERQVYVGVPMDLPEPNEPGFDAALAAFLEPALLASRGRALILFTAYAMLQQVFDRLAPTLERRGLPCMRQGQSSRSMLTEALRRGTASVLFATASFWEGVDIPGEALSCLVLTRLPFRVPGEPIVEARVDALRARGLDPFQHLIVPQAVIRFRQGFGRLIRTRTDRGAVLVCDRRVASRPYGRMFIRSLPTTSIHYAASDDLHEHLRAFFEA